MVQVNTIYYSPQFLTIPYNPVRLAKQAFKRFQCLWPIAHRPLRSSVPTNRQSRRPSPFMTLGYRFSGIPSFHCILIYITNLCGFFCSSFFLTNGQLNLSRWSIIVFPNGQSRWDAIMKTTYINTGSTARLSGDIDDLFTQLEQNAAAPVQPSGNEFLHCHECSNPECCSSCPSNLDLAAAPVNQDVPTSRGSSRPNADKLHYRHQPVINSVFKIELARVGAIKPITGPFIYSPATGIVREQSK